MDPLRMARLSISTISTPPLTAPQMTPMPVYVPPDSHAMSCSRVGLVVW